MSPFTLGVLYIIAFTVAMGGFAWLAQKHIDKHNHSSKK